MRDFQQMHFYANRSKVFYAWIRQSGGNDGLHQYSWVIIYEMALQHALQEAGYTAYILVKGDTFIPELHFEDMNYIPEIIPTAAEAEEQGPSPQSIHKESRSWSWAFFQWLRSSSQNS